MVYRLLACALVFALATTTYAQNCPNGGGGPPGGGPPGGGPPGMGTNIGGAGQTGIGGGTNGFQQMMMQQMIQAMMQQQMANQQRMRQPPMLNAPPSRPRTENVVEDEDEAETRKRVLPTDRPLTSFERRVAALKEKEELRRLEYEKRIQQREAELALRR